MTLNPNPTLTLTLALTLALTLTLALNPHPDPNPNPDPNPEPHPNLSKALNERLGVSNDAYVRTTSPKHKAAAQELWRKAAAKGEIYLHYYKGWYL